RLHCAVAHGFVRSGIAPPVSRPATLILGAPILEHTSDMWSLRAWRRKRILARFAVEPALWQAVLDSLPMLDGLNADELDRLRERSILFLHAKRLTALPSVELEMADRLRL